MSRIGRLPIDIPAGVEVKIEEGNKVTVKGPKGTLEKCLPVEMTIKQEDNQVVVTRPNDLKKMKSLHGLTRSLIANMITGVSEGYEKKLEIKIRAKKHYKLRNRINGTSERPRLSVFRSNDHMYAQIIDDTVGNTLVSASTTQKDVKAELEKTNDVAAASYLGKVIAERALAKGITEVVFDRGGFIYHGKIEALADAAREAGLKF